MNPEILQSIQRRLLDVESKIQATDKKLTALKIDKQMFIPKSERIKPGIAIKVAYNEYGQITGSSSLETVDIPQLAIEKIDGLSEHLKSSVKTSEIEKLKKEIKSYFTRSEADITGCKVNVNKNGIVTSVSDLTVEDIPELPINKISGLTNILESLKQSSNSVEMITVDEKIITAGTGCKISFDEYGRVTNSENLSITDLPLELINKICNNLDSEKCVFTQKRRIKMFLRTKNLNQLLELKDNSRVKIITGIRKCGKSFLLKNIFKEYLINNGVQSDHIIYLELDDFNNNYLLNPISLNDYIRSKIIDDDKYYLIIDEIQKVISIINPILTNNKIIKASNKDEDVINFTSY